MMKRLFSRRSGASKLGMVVSFSGFEITLFMAAVAHSAAVSRFAAGHVRQELEDDASQQLQQHSTVAGLGTEVALFEVVVDEMAPDAASINIYYV